MGSLIREWLPLRFIQVVHQIGHASKARPQSCTLAPYERAVWDKERDPKSLCSMCVYVLYGVGKDRVETVSSWPRLEVDPA